jgi:hypothetical protein
MMVQSCCSANLKRPVDGVTIQYTMIFLLLLVTLLG